MKKIKLVLLVMAVFAASSAFAQGKYGADSLECIKYLSYYQEYYKQKAYDEAIPSWRNAYKHCPPSCSQNLLLNGQTLVRRLIMKNGANKEYRAALVDTLMRLHDLRAENFPKYAVKALNSKGQDIFNYIRNDNQRLFDEYSSIIEANKEQTKPTLFVHHFNAAVGLQKEGKLSTEELIDIYQSNAAILEKINPEANYDKEEVAKAEKELETRFVASKVADCSTLLAFYEPKFNADPTNPELASSIVRMLNSTDDCLDNDLFLRAVTTVYKDRPSHSSAYFLFRLNAKNDNVEEAIKYLEEAIASEESDAIQDAGYYSDLAQFCFSNGKIEKAYECAAKAAEMNPEVAGKSYYLMGNIWGTLQCGTGVTGAAHYWVAVDYMLKAKNADSTLTEEANRCIGLFSSAYPEVGEAFMEGIENGQSYTVTCGGLKATTTVRLKK